MIDAPRPAAHQALPAWLYEGAKVYDPGRDREAVVQAIADFEDSATRRVIKNAVFLRPEGGGIEWIVDPGVPRPPDGR
ncbi:hypothetical protein [Streptomyces sp. gCLA4]|uniref:hypothetical protein n=1 Tax=Streptomyces sp. gCLA4 TaxID=1873416 RepID=UPI001601061D|nr:hypothetical protein [Streptomyces sp. gCLA4]